MRTDLSPEKRRRGIFDKFLLYIKRERFRIHIGFGRRFPKNGCFHSYYILSHFEGVYKRANCLKRNLTEEERCLKIKI
jgi:hypothetical protein